jgi:quercetin dioxygenase-like cupin family protein
MKTTTETTRNGLDAARRFGALDATEADPALPSRRLSRVTVRRPRDAGQESRGTRLWRVVLLAIAALALWPATVFGQELPPGPSTVHALARLPIGQDPGPIDETQTLLLDFAPGAWTPLHTHGGSTLVRVLEGEMTRRRGATEDRFRAGESWVEQPGDVHAAGNASSTPARVLVTFLLARGAPLTTVAGTPSQSAPPGPTTVFQSKRVPVDAAAAGYNEAATTVLGFAPAAWTPRHTHGGLTLVAVIEGEMRVRSGGRETVYRAGDLWVEPGAIHQAGNMAPNDARVAVTFLLQQGRPVTTLAEAQAPAQLPRTGGPVVLAAVAAASAAALLGAGVHLRRRVTRA